MKSIILQTKQGTIIKSTDFPSESTLRRWKAKHGRVAIMEHHMSGVCVFAAGFHYQSNMNKRLALPYSRPTPNAIHLQSKAAKWADRHGAPAHRRGGWTEVTKDSIPHRLAARYALSPGRYTAPQISPALP